MIFGRTADLLTQLCRIQISKYTKYSFNLNSLICVKISGCLHDNPFSIAS